MHLTLVRDAAGQPSHYLVSVQDISALKQVQQQALGLATQLHAVLEAMPVGVWIGDAQGQTERINPAVQILGLYGKPEQTSGRSDHESLMRRAVITGDVVRSGLRAVPDAQGVMREIQITAKPILDARGRAVGVLAVDEDLTEARRSALALRHSSELLERIFNASMAGMALVNEAGEVVRCNLAWRLLVDAMEGQSLLATLSAADLITVREELAAIARGERGMHMGEHAVRRPAAEPAWTSLVLSRLPGENDEQLRLLVQAVDVDARRRADEEIAAARLRLTAAQRMAGMGEWQLDVERGVVTCSMELLRLLGYGPSEQVLPRGRWIERMPTEDRATYAAALEQALQGDGRLSIDTRLMRPDGEVMVVHLHAVMQRSGSGKVLMGTLQDVTERKRIEDALRASREQLRALVVYEGQLIEDERKRIAREVHDELGQLVTALRMDLSMLRQRLAADPDALQRAERMRQTMATMSDVVRHVASHLRPGALDMGLVAAIEWLAEDFSLRWETRCQLELPHEQEPSLPESVALALFRAVQESLTNIAKHAQASEVTIALEQRGTLLHPTVRDNGRGFDPEVVAARRGGGLGLLGMRERMLAIGAVIDIATGPQPGLNPAQDEGQGGAGQVEKQMMRPDAVETGFPPGGLSAGQQIDDMHRQTRRLPGHVRQGRRTVRSRDDAACIPESGHVAPRAAAQIQHSGSFPADGGQEAMARGGAVMIGQKFGIERRVCAVMGQRRVRRPARHRMTPIRRSFHRMPGAARIGWRRCHGDRSSRTPECRCSFHSR